MGHEWEGGFSGMIMGWLWNDYEICCWMYPFSIQHLHPAPTATYCNYPIAVPRREELPATQESPTAHGIETVRQTHGSPKTRGLLILGVKLSMKPRAQVSPCELSTWGESKMANLEVFRVLFRHTHQTCPGCSRFSRWDNIEMIYNS
jgi:hypothetical protein